MRILLFRTGSGSLLTKLTNSNPAPVSQDLPDAFTFYSGPEYIHSQTIMNNIFFGKI